MRRLMQVCQAEPLNPAALRSALDQVLLSELPQLAVFSGSTGRPLSHAAPLGTLVPTLKHVTTLAIFENTHVNVTLFALPPKARLPMHDHPGMTVHHRLLSGRLHHLSVDWTDGAPAVNGPREPRRGVVTENQWVEAAAAASTVSGEGQGGDDVSAASSDDTTVSASGTFVIEPSCGGVLHAFTAGPDTPAVFIDVISPPYHSPEPGTGAPLACTFFDLMADEGGEGTVIAADGSYAGCPLKPGAEVSMVPVASASPHMDFFDLPRGRTPPSPGNSSSPPASGGSSPTGSDM